MKVFSSNYSLAKLLKSNFFPGILQRDTLSSLFLSLSLSLSLSLTLSLFIYLIPMINPYFFVLLNIFNTVARSHQINWRTERAEHKVQSVFAKMRYYKDKVASWEFCSYRS